MLIHQSDFIIINLEKAQDKYHHSYFKQEGDLAEKGEVIGDGFCLVFNIQINGKIKRAEYRFEVQSQEDYYKLNPEKSNDPDIKEYVIIDYRGIYATLGILTDLGYNLKNGEFENHYKIISKIEEEIVYYYECNKNNNTIGEPKTI